ncbi:hypothetical protein K8I85_14280, partial [bacterium]|nr:hypothetical protein [bacterium]
GGFWYLDTDSAWHRRDTYDLPVPASELAMICGEGPSIVAVATDGRCWWAYDDGLGWREAPFPSGPVSLQAESWGKLKAAHR